MALSEDTLDIIQRYFPDDVRTVKKLSSIPGFDDELNAGFQNAINETRTLEGYDPSGGNFLKQNIEAASTNPTEYVLKAMRSGVRSAVNQADPALLTKQIEYLKQNNVPLQTIQTRYTEHATKQAEFDARNVELKAQQGGGFFGKIGRDLAQVDKDLGLSQNAPVIAAIALSVAAPGVGSAIGQQMIAAGLLPAATSAAVASAIGASVANAALSVAQGQSPEEALKSAVVGSVAGYAGGQVGDYLVGDPGVAKNIVSSTAANMALGKDPETAVKTALVQSGIQGTADVISQAQAEKYIENLPVPDYLQAGPTTTSADVMATFPETNPANFVGPPTDIDTTLLDLTTPSNFVGPPTAIDTTLLDLSTAAPSTPTTQTYTYEDGSTLTVDETGGVVGYTDATETPYKGPVETPSSPLTKSQIEGMIKLGLTVAGASAAANAVQNAISSGGDAPQGGFPFTPSDISGWASPTYTQTWQAPIDINSLFTTDNLLGGTQWAGLQGNQFANIPQVSMSDFISSIQNGKV